MSAAQAEFDKALHSTEAVLAAPGGALGRSLTLGGVSTIARLVLNVLNTTKIINQDALITAVTDRPPGTGLMTVCNHTSMFDDPGVLSLVMPWEWLWLEPKLQHVRWSLCAREVCFKNELLR
ncbi:Tafazzin [Tetrabaena socialis]|uniref:Tafazzin family protein n=1 Tax=Tetrabaena socialis TaxID=47790 RepID=A0A2J7ZZT5_9CHLO|nr:Tafazzin [Tetrabaena socialis]|eukprot:PNH05758.1 Tafazzin [Tetrabaena socialis]